MVEQPDKTKMGIAAAKAGQTEQARELLISALEENDQDINAWMWLSAVVDTDQDRLDCMEQVLLINPNHPQALKARAFLQSRLSSSPTRDGIDSPPSREEVSGEEVSSQAPVPEVEFPASIDQENPGFDESEETPLSEPEGAQKDTAEFSNFEQVQTEDVVATNQVYEMADERLNLDRQQEQLVEAIQPVAAQELPSETLLHNQGEDRREEEVVENQSLLFENVPVVNSTMPDPVFIPALLESGTPSGKQASKGSPRVRHVGPFTILPPELADLPEYQQDTVIVMNPVAVALLIILGVSLLVMVILAGALLIFDPQMFWSNITGFFSGLWSIIRG
jgi:hypothetical protein